MLLYCFWTGSTRWTWCDGLQGCSRRYF